MEDSKTVIIPTRTKERISHELSFPIGAERISVALASVLQLSQLVLHFRSERYDHLRVGHRPFLVVRYSGKKWPEALNSTDSSGIPLFNKWEIEVMPVPRIFRHRFQQYILDSALPQIKEWLDQRAGSKHDGWDNLGFFYNNENEEFTPKQDARLEPTRSLSQKP